MPARSLFVLNRADDRSGGTLTAALNLAAALDEDGVEVTLAVPVGPGRAASAAVRSASFLEARCFPAGRWSVRFGFSWALLRYLWSSVRSFDEVHVHSGFYAAAYLTALICRVRHVPYAVWPHGSLDAYDVQKNRLVKRLVGPLAVRPMLAHARVVLCTSAREVDDLVTYGARPTTGVVPLPVRSQGFVSTRPARSDGSFEVLFLGRITAKKRLPTLVDAVARLADLDVHLVIAGEADDPALLDRVRVAVRGHGLDDRVRLAGWLDADGRAAAFASADVFALPSENENFGLAMAEALLAGLPAVVSENVYLARELERAGAALVAPATAEGFADALRLLASDVGRRSQLADAGRAYAEQTFAPRRVAALVAEAFGRAAGHRSTD